MLFHGANQGRTDRNGVTNGRHGGCPEMKTRGHDQHAGVTKLDAVPMSNILHGRVIPHMPTAIQVGVSHGDA